MIWRVEFEDIAIKELKRLDQKVQKRIINFLKDRVAVAENPRRLGKALRGNLGAYWRYHFGDYRLVCRIEDDKVLVLRVGHRKKVYATS